MTFMLKSHRYIPEPSHFGKVERDSEREKKHMQHTAFGTKLEMPTTAESNGIGMVLFVVI